jgi:hypothetical protein
MLRFNINDTVYLPVINPDNTKTYMSLKILAYTVKDHKILYQVDDLLGTWYKETELMNKEELLTFLNTKK